MEGADLVKDVTCAEAYDFALSLADTVAEASFGAAPAAGARSDAARRRLRLRHQDQHPAPPGRARLRGARVSRRPRRLQELLATGSPTASS